MKLFVFVVFTLILNFTVRAFSFYENNYEINTNDIREHTSTMCGMNDIAKAVKSAKCKPRETLVKLPHIPGYENMHPTMATVQRCAGYCQPNVVCSPLKTAMKRVPVRAKLNFPLKIFNKKQKPVCMLNFVEEHTACKCKCKKMKDHCNERQRFVQSNCACECVNYKDREICGRQKNMMWDENTCTCKCNRNVEFCSTGLAWVPEKCSCVKIMDSIEEYYGK